MGNQGNVLFGLSHQRRNRRCMWTFIYMFFFSFNTCLKYECCCWVWCYQFISWWLSSYQCPHLPVGTFSRVSLLPESSVWRVLVSEQEPVYSPATAACWASVSRQDRVWQCRDSQGQPVSVVNGLRSGLSKAVLCFPCLCEKIGFFAVFFPLRCESQNRKFPLKAALSQ